MPGRVSRRLDVLFSVAIFVAVSLAGGRIYRLPFDDEIFTLRFVGAPHAHLAHYLLMDADPTPQLSYVIYYLAMLAGCGQVGWRWLCVGYVAVAISIWHWLTLRNIEASRPVRLLIAILFGMTPLALGQGDALRWYPMLAMMVAVAFALYLTAGERWYLTGIAFGLVGDVSFLAILPLASVLFHRWVIERKFRPREEAAFLVLGGIVAIPGFLKFHNISSSQDLTLHFTRGVLRRVLETSLGFFGGATLGASQAWLVGLAVGATVFLGYSAMVSVAGDANASRFCTLLGVSAIFPAIFTLIGFSEPRGYLFLAPMMVALTAVGVARAISIRPHAVAIAYVALLVVAISVAANLRSSTTPFKRNAVIPYQEVLDFVTTNQQGPTTLLTMDAVTGYSLASVPQLCVEEYEVDRSGWRDSSCAPDAATQTVIIVKGDPLNEDEPTWRDKTAAFIGTRKLMAQAHFGYDADASLKSRLTGRHLAPSLLDAEIYR
jgi:hypothetical protein